MTQKQVLLHAAKRVATAMMLLALIGTAGCMTGRERVVSPARSDVTSMTYSTIAFRSTRIEQADAGHWKVTGNLTLRGTTRPVLLDVESSRVEGTRASAHVSTTIDRRDFGMTYAGFAVGKQIGITIDAIGFRTLADAPPR